MKLWLFGTYAWQGNPKALYLYMQKHYSSTHECWWIADNEADMKAIKKTIDLEKITFMESKKAKELFAKADVYVTENFRESYPIEMNENIKIFNTWHGVGLKHVEFALGMDSVLADSIVRKYIKNYSLYKNNVVFLTTSQKMESHFLEDTVIRKELIVRGKYPRNEVYGNDGIHTYEVDNLLPKPKTEYNNLILFTPTYRIGAIQGVLNSLLPNLDEVETICRENNSLFILKVHPFMEKDDYFLDMEKKYKNSEHIFFWNNKYDIYESFNSIDIAIVDYSSIFYDMLDAGIEKFIRYIPDLEAYQNDLELIGDYMDLTEGQVVRNFQSLLETLAHNNIKPISNERKSYLMNYFFGFETSNDPMKNLIQAVDNIELKSQPLKELHTFDIFDTLIRRSTLKPLSIFDYVRDRAKASSIPFPVALIEKWVEIRHKVEHDVRDMMRKTTFERNSNTLEITLDDIYRRLQQNLLLSDEQVNFLKQTEIEAEIAHVEPIKKRIDFLFSLKEKGHDVAMVSDMYLPESVIRQMLDQADIRLREIPLYLSSTIGYQKSTGKLYQYIFFHIHYQYNQWVHYGDNKHADGMVPRRFGIQTVVHDIDEFIPFETALVNAMDNYNRYPAYQLATKMHRYRSNLVQNLAYDNKAFETQYYNYAYVGSVFVPYINWAIKDALKRGYETLYFISRDGHFLKQIADKIIEIQGYHIKTKYIYGSRKAWRLPSFITKVDDETFWQFGNFVGMDCFADLIKASYLNEKDLLALFPEFESLRYAKHLRGTIAENIRKIFKNSPDYHEKVLTLAAEKRTLVRQYLQQEINPNEKFAFVEFWGRGYTQDTFGRLLNDAFGKEITNPFYYVRSFTENMGTSVRHNFVLAPQNFTFFEPIFAQTPYESIPGYVEENGRIAPIIVPREDFIPRVALISQGLLDFTTDYLALQTNDADYFDTALATFSYQYQMTNHNDQFICNVFSELTDNISSFGEVKAYAPRLTLKQLQNIASKQELDKLTLSIPISLAKSDKQAIEYYQKIQKNYKLPAYNGETMKLAYAINPFANYVISQQVPFKVIALNNNSFYYDVNFNENTKRKDIFLKKMHTIDVIAIDWMKVGIPRLLTEYGYITANKDWVALFDETLFTPKEDGSYKISSKIESLMSILLKNEKEEPPKLATQHRLSPTSNTEIKVTSKLSTKAIVKPVPNKKSAVQKTITPKNLTEKERKRRKLARDPYLFFKDAKNPFASSLRIFFNERNAFGRMMSRWVRKISN
ncbi:MAG: CDP-glycerol glycerophosphotransferase family protein [[Pasteurella] mairii]|uniref:CDP-glycerol:poly(Glycerophosphate) glycerophosphotransferase n=1 Tax=[Pasteurella] mairii TaxID=757 RepID=A0A379B269_9PAST|nr:CDP-glycerol glycerophosphotransferase family protein [[Pasteurella] mairii]SUB32542.1 CDP-glycerol:poly(glycerophosphate) glycerophosphotransferase [[Pasteurella] mairii]